ncbi:uncharacterized protein [Diabrotica undecimpunctata]|uniref:uncharacterized protein isoform X2 n=1 Tax=Diabrotica undecimpunctata TaxID=50387 RepID=UPI003B63DCCA
MPVEIEALLWELTTKSSDIPNITNSNSNDITTVIIFVISAIFVIALFFILAIFIDCRQEKLKKLQSKPKKRLLKLKLPIPIIGPPVREDENSILDKMEQGESSQSSNVI